MSQNELDEGKAICNEIGGAVLTILGEKRKFSVQSLIDIMQEAQKDSHDYGREREKGMESAIRILQKFT